MTVPVPVAPPLGGFDRLRVEPDAHIGDLAVGVEETRADEVRRGDIAGLSRDESGARIQRGQAVPKVLQPSSPRREVALGDDDAIGDRRLPDRLRVGVERGKPVHSINDRDHPIERVAHREIRVIEHRVQDGGRVGQPCRFDDDAPEWRYPAVVAPAQQILEGGDEVAADRAAEAARREQDHALVHRFDEEVIEADLAELVDDHDRVGEGGVAEETIEERRLARAKEAGEHGQRDRRQRAARRSAHRNA
jgi:hypothetical protein